MEDTIISFSIFMCKLCSTEASKPVCHLLHYSLTSVFTHALSLSSLAQHVNKNRNLTNAQAMQT